MSSLYNLEPQPTAKVLLQTTAGDIELELFAKQTPLASRNFLQLCLDGYYDGTIFHRLVPGFVIQGGDPTGTGEGGEAIYDGGLFADEFHSRLKFNRRGLLGMANTGRKDDNGSQFFITLGKTEELNGKNTMFGRVVGDTIYNVMKMGEAELVDMEGSERPLYPTKIISTEVLVNPFEDMVARKAQIKGISTEKEPERKKPKKRAVKALLSFGADEGDTKEAPIVKKAKFNPKLVKPTPETGDEHIKLEVKKHLKARPVPNTASDSPPTSPVSKLNLRPETQLPLPDNENPSRSPSASPEPGRSRKERSALDRTNAQIDELKASLKRNVAVPAPQKSTKKSALEEMIPATSIRGRKRKQGALTNTKAESQALEMLNSFRAKLENIQPDTGFTSKAKETLEDTTIAPSSAIATEENDEEAHLCDLHFIANCLSCSSWDQEPESHADANDDGDNWMSHALNFEKDRLGKDLTWKKNNEDSLVVIDPREKAKEIQAEQKMKRGSKLSKRSDNRQWDKDRDRGHIPGKLAGEK